MIDIVVVIICTIYQLLYNLFCIEKSFIFLALLKKSSASLLLLTNKKKKN